MQLTPGEKKTLIHQFLQSPLLPIPTLSHRISRSLQIPANTIEIYLNSVTETKMFGRVLKKNVLADLEKEQKEIVQSRGKAMEREQNNRNTRGIKEEYNTQPHNTYANMERIDIAGVNEQRSNQNIPERKRNKKATTTSTSRKIATAKRINNLEKYIKKRQCITKTEPDFITMNSTSVSFLKPRPDYKSQLNDRYFKRGPEDGEISTESNFNGSDTSFVPTSRNKSMAGRNNLKTSNTTGHTTADAKGFNTTVHAKGFNTTVNAKGFNTTVHAISSNATSSNTINSNATSSNTTSSNTINSNTTSSTTFNNNGFIIVPKELSHVDKISDLLLHCPPFTFKDVPQALLTEYLVVYDFYCKFRQLLEIDQKNTKYDSFSSSFFRDSNFYDLLKNIEPYSNRSHLTNTHLTMEQFHDLLLTSYHTLFEKAFSLIQNERKREKVTVVMEMVEGAINTFWERECIGDELDSDENISQGGYSKTNEQILKAHSRTNWATTRASFLSLLSFFIDAKRLLRKSVPSTIDLRIIQNELFRNSKKLVIDQAEERAAKKPRFIDSSDVKEPSVTEKSTAVKETGKKGQSSVTKKDSSIKNDHDTKGCNTVLTSKIKLLKFLIDIIYETNVLRNSTTDWNKDIEDDCTRLREFIKNIRMEMRKIKNIEFIKNKEIDHKKNRSENKVKRSVDETDQGSIQKILNLKKLPPLPNKISDLEYLLNKSLAILEALQNLLKENNLGCEIYQQDHWVFLYVDRRILAYSTPDINKQIKTLEIKNTHQKKQMKKETTEQPDMKGGGFCLIDDETKRMLTMVGGINMAEAFKFCTTSR